MVSKENEDGTTLLVDQDGLAQIRNVTRQSDLYYERKLFSLPMIVSNLENFSWTKNSLRRF